MKTMKLWAIPALLLFLPFPRLAILTRVGPDIGSTRSTTPNQIRTTGPINIPSPNTPLRSTPNPTTQNHRP